MTKTDDVCYIKVHYESTATVAEIRATILQSKLFEERADRPEGYFYPLDETPYFIKVSKPAKSINGVAAHVMVCGISVSSADIPKIIDITEKIIKFAEY